MMCGARERASEGRTGTPDVLSVGQDLFRRVLDQFHDGVYVVDQNLGIIYWNDAAERITGYSREETVGDRSHVSLLDHADARGQRLTSGVCPLAAAVADGQSREARVSIRHKDGHRIPIDVHVMPLPGEDGTTLVGVEVFRDASALIALEGAFQRLKILAEIDTLTGLANRRTLDLVLDRQAEDFQKTGTPFSVILIDLDHFKRVNDTFGHVAGDHALVAMADHLRTHCRPADLVSRYGGEEFVVVIRGQQLPVAKMVAERLRKMTPAATPPELGKHRLTASFGVAEAVPGESAEALIRRADQALYRAKKLGRDRVEVGETGG